MGKKLIEIQAGRRLVRSLLTVRDIDVYVFSCICHTPLIILIHPYVRMYAVNISAKAELHSFTRSDAGFTYL